MTSPFPRPLLIGLLALASAAPGSAGGAVSGSWTSLGPDGGPVWALASPPGNPKVVYAGGSGGLYKSVDGGATWSRAGRGLNPLSPMSRLAIDPLHPSTLYAGLQRGLFKSVDGGATWKQIDLGSAQLINCIAIHPRFPETVFVGTELGLYQSSNGGARWRLLTRGLPSAPFQAETVAIDPTSPRRMFATFLDQFSLKQKLFSSLDGGFSWQQVQSDLFHTIGLLVVDPWSPRSLWAVTPSGLYRSTNGGRSWIPSFQNDGQISDSVLSLIFPPTQKNLIYASGFAGVFRSLDDGATWSSLSQGLPPGAIVSSLLASGSRATTLIVGLINPPRSTGLYRSTDGGTSWTRSDRGIADSSVTSLAMDPEDSNTLWVTSLGTLFKSTDRGRTWNPSPLPADIGESLGSSTAKIVISPFDRETLLLELIDGRLFRSRDGGQSWVMAGAPFAYEAEVLKADPLDAATFWAGGIGGLKKSTNRGDTWTPLPLPVAPSEGSVNDLAFAPSSPSTVYAGGTFFDIFLFKALLLRSEDAGANWTAAQGGLPASIVSLAVDPQHPETVYTVTRSSGDIYKTVDGGSTWSVVNNVFHDRIVERLAISPSGVLYAAVQADNVYESEDGGLSWAPLGERPSPYGFTSLATDPKDPCRIYAGTQNQRLLAFTKTGTAVCP
jgi:photosystem II stability/assembly factor-like uncharacterized protein